MATLRVATLRQRRTHREAIMKTLYEDMEGGGLPDVSGARSRDESEIPGEENRG